MSDLLDAALAYAAAGWSVFPVLGATPAVRWRDESTTDPAQLQQWWATWPSANIGIDTGKSGLTVVDVDPGGQWADQTQETLTAYTGREGGRHHYFVGGGVPNSAGRLGQNVDVRGDGGFVFAPPSVSAKTGRTYRWANSLPLQPLPDPVRRAALPPERPEPGPPAPAGEANDRWGQRILEAEVARIALAPEGERNHTLFQAACNIYEAVKGGHIDRDLADQALETSAHRAGLEGLETERTLQSAWERTDERHPQPLPGPTMVDVPLAQVGDDEPGFDLLSPADLMMQPPPRWLIPDRLPEGMTIIAGRKASGKTLTVIDWAATVAAISDRPVIYFVGEGYSGFVQRALTWMTHHQADLSSRLWVVRGVPRMMEEASRRKFYATVRRSQAGLVVVDTYARAVPGVNENESAPATSVVDALGYVQESYDTSSILVMHTGAADERVRGHTSLEDAADAVWLSKRNRDAPDQYTLKNDKMKDDEEQSPQLYRILPSGPSIVAFPSEYPRMTQHG